MIILAIIQAYLDWLCTLPVWQFLLISNLVVGIIYWLGEISIILVDKIKRYHNNRKGVN